jgi:hypothetical protein
MTARRLTRSALAIVCTGLALLPVAAAAQEIILQCEYESGRTEIFLIDPDRYFLSIYDDSSYQFKGHSCESNEHFILICDFSPRRFLQIRKYNTPTATVRESHEIDRQTGSISSVYRGGPVVSGTCVPTERPSPPATRF